MKKGQGMSVQTVVMIILGLVVLAIIIMVVRQQVTKGASKYTEIGSQAEINTTKCGNIILNRACAASCDRTKGQQEVFSPTGSWEDCKDASKSHCCRS